MAPLPCLARARSVISREPTQTVLSCTLTLLTRNLWTRHSIFFFLGILMCTLFLSKQKGPQWSSRIL